MAIGESETATVARLNRERVVRGAVGLADRDGVDALSMRTLAKHLGVVPMALYKHVASKEQLLDEMVDALVAEIEAAPPGPDWRPGIRSTVLSARRMLLRHPWARPVLETRTRKTLAVLGYLDRISAILLAGGLTPDLAHHAMHALGSRAWGFTQELFDESTAAAPQPQPPPEVQEAMLRELAARFPSLAVTASAVQHDDTAVGDGCDDQFEFEFALDTLLDGIERLQRAGWTSHPADAGPGRRR